MYMKSMGFLETIKALVFALCCVCLLTHPFMQYFCYIPLAVVLYRQNSNYTYVWKNFENAKNVTHSCNVGTLLLPGMSVLTLGY